MMLLQFMPRYLALTHCQGSWKQLTEKPHMDAMTSIVASATHKGFAMAKVISGDICGPSELEYVPDGEWTGTWSGYSVKAKCGHGLWTFRTDEGIRGIDVPCIVKARCGVITVEVHKP